MDPELNEGLIGWDVPITGMHQKNGLVVWDYVWGGFCVQDGDDSRYFTTAAEVLFYLEEEGLL